MDLQKYIDRLLVKTVLPFIPHSISPNQVSWLRIFSIPIIFYLLASHHNLSALVLFSISSLTDGVDGAMARSRNQITETGKVLDALADKGLIALVAFWFIPQYFGSALLVWMIVLEIFSALLAYRSKLKLKRNPGANWASKVKMVIQCIAFIFLFIGLFFPLKSWIQWSYILLYASLVFTFLQAMLYLKSE